MTNFQESIKTFFNDLIFGGESKFLPVVPYSVREDLEAHSGNIKLKTLLEVNDRHFSDLSIYFTIKAIHGDFDKQQKFIESILNLKFPRYSNDYMSSLKKLQQDALDAIDVNQEINGVKACFVYRLGPEEIQENWSRIFENIFKDNLTVPCVLGYSSYIGLVTLWESMKEGQTTVLFNPDKLNPSESYGFILRKKNEAASLELIDLDFDLREELNSREVIVVDDAISKGETIKLVQSLFGSSKSYPKIKDVVAITKNHGW